MSGERRTYTMTTFTVVPGREAEFIDAWRDAAAAAMEFVPGAIMGQILHDRMNPRRLVAMGVWEDTAAVETWRGLPEYDTFVMRVAGLCEEIDRFTLDAVARASRDLGSLETVGRFTQPRREP